MLKCRMILNTLCPARPFFLIAILLTCANGSDQLYVNYTIFEPETAKVRQSGRTHQSIYKTGRVGVSGPSKNSPLYSEYALKQSARETAERILEAFDIKLRDERW